MFKNYSDIFEEKQDDNEPGITLRSGVTKDKLIEKFRGYLAWDVLLAFVNEESIKELGVA